MFRRKVPVPPLNDSNIHNVVDDYIEGRVNYPNINSWDVSNVTNMTDLFNSYDFNQPLNNWDVSNVTNMSYMFNKSNFNQHLPF